MGDRRWAVVGAGGMLGRELMDVLQASDQEVRGFTRSDLDATDRATCLEQLDGFDVVVNAAAFTAVDEAERREAEAFAGNALVAASLGAAAAATGARLVQVSTDYVFDGRATEPYAEDAPTAPRSAYGRSKLAGEWAAAATCPDHLVVRTAWLYGDGPCFPRTIARLLSDREVVSVVDDQRGQPTWTRDLAELVLQLVAAGAPSGTYHGTASGSGTWRDLAEEVAASLGVDRARVASTTSAAFVRPAPRPAWSVLAHGNLDDVGVRPIGEWRDRWSAAAGHVLVGDVTR